MAGFDFIDDIDLKKKLDDSIEYIYALYEKSKNDGESQLYKEETYRVIILYIISAIEAILLFFYKKRGDKINYIEYKHDYHLPKEYSYRKKPGLPVVIAIQEKLEKKDHQIGLYDLVTFFYSLKLIHQNTVDEILELNDVRNTFHFSKPRTKKCDISRVESALNLLIRTIENAPKALRVKKI